MKYFKVEIKNDEEVKTAILSAETEEKVKAVCEEQGFTDYNIIEIKESEFKELTTEKIKKVEKKIDTEKQKLMDEAKFEAEEVKKIDIKKFKGKKIISKDPKVVIDKKYIPATKENILKVASDLNVYPFKDARMAARWLIREGFEIK